MDRELRTLALKIGSIALLVIGAAGLVSLNEGRYPRYFRRRFGVCKLSNFCAVPVSGDHFLRGDSRDS